MAVQKGQRSYGPGQSRTMAPGPVWAPWIKFHHINAPRSETALGYAGREARRSERPKETLALTGPWPPSFQT